jgi:hypothetical protein
MALLHEVAGRLQAKVKQSTQAINRLHNLLARVLDSARIATWNTPSPSKAKAALFLWHSGRKWYPLWLRWKARNRLRC